MPVYLFNPDFLRETLKYPPDVRKTDDIVKLLFSFSSGVRAPVVRYNLNDPNLKEDPKYKSWVNFATAFEQLYISRRTHSA